MRNFKLWLLLAVMVTGTMASGFFFTGFLAYWNFRNNPAIRSEPQVWLPFLTLGITAILVSILLTLLISRRFFQPIEHLIHALKQVTAGDFQVRLPETARDPEIEEMNINFNKMVKELTSMEMLQADFIQNVSHEIKTPLSAIEGYASPLYSEELSEEGKQYMQRILESTKRLSHLTGNILMLSKLENQQIVSQKHPFSLDEQLRQAVLLLEPFWDKKSWFWILICRKPGFSAVKSCCTRCGPTCFPMPSSSRRRGDASWSGWNREARIFRWKSGIPASA